MNFPWTQLSGEAPGGIEPPSLDPNSSALAIGPGGQLFLECQVRWIQISGHKKTRIFLRSGCDVRNDLLPTDVSNGHHTQVLNPPFPQLPVADWPGVAVRMRYRIL